MERKRDNLKIKAVGYVRVSTKRQVLQGFSLLSQSKRIAGTAQERGWSLKMFQDEGVSGHHISNRQGIQSLIREIKCINQIDYLIVTKLDRLSRNAKELLQLMELFQKNGVELISLTEQLDDFTTPVGMVQAQIYGAVAEFERSIIQENVQLALAHKFQQGRIISSQLPYGYFLDGQHKVQIEITTSVIVKFIYEKYLEGRGYRKLSTLVKERFNRDLQPVRIKQILMNQHYIGIDKTNYGKRQDIYPPIIEKQIFAEVQSLMVKKRKFCQKRKTRKKPQLLQGKLICPLCKHHMSDNRVCSNGKTYSYYYCSVGTNYSRQDKAYHSYRLRSADVERKVTETIHDIFKSEIFQKYFIKAVVRHFSTNKKIKGDGKHSINHKQIFRQFENGDLTVEQLRERLVLASDRSTSKNGQRKMKLSLWLEIFSKLERDGFIDLVVNSVIIDQRKNIKSILLVKGKFDLLQLKKELL
ncbi:recombinase family protein [Liquorilactobacillus uvarum]|uniref:Uncharacterized protein n=1 Tax=Liquorilactobacillus uvarum DSM 19971 TaxID=1423812 RepID=A0A0R1Q1N5_9LACO|nr:recombinase family protein [Liquorilactobacillus uvarum]KRL38350.1 hypothetical protein FD20_GL001971 [Liquorilactobacillus uvarum DSM 19971]